MKSFKKYLSEAINGPKIIMIGGPGSGKSTYSKIITEKLKIPHIYTGDMMRDLAKVAKILWPKWLMPSPKSWTVAVNLKDTVDEIKKWRVEFKLDKTWNIHAIVWNVSFDNQKLIENIQVLLKAIEDNKPSWVKWKLFKKVVINPTMGPSIQLNY